MLWVYSAGDRLYTSESDVYRSQILRYKDGPDMELLSLYLRVRVKITHIYLF